MAKVLQFRRGTTSGISTITGLEGELFVDLTKDTLVVMDGSTAGGQALQKEITASTNVNAGVVTATTFSGSLGNTLTLNTSGTGLSGSTTFNNSGAATFTVTSNATSANTAGAIVSRNALGGFTAGIVTTSSITSPFIMSYNQISSNFTVPSNYNAASVGPVLTINNGVVITVETNANWFILQPAS